MIAKYGDSAWKVAKDLYKARGLVEFWRGVSARMMSMSISSSLLLSVYEVVKRVAIKNNVTND